MKIAIEATKAKEKICTITHRGNVLRWVVGYFVKSPGTVASEDDVAESREDLFVYVNQYFNYISESDQDKLFELYAQARELLTQCQTHDELVINLRVAVAKIVDFKKFLYVHQWIRYQTDIRDPASVNDTFQEDAAGRNKPDKTYIKSQYQELVTLTFIIRMLLPVLGEFTARISAYIESTGREMAAFDLIKDSELMASTAMERLKSFIRNTIPPDTNRSSALIDGISSEDYERWLLALVVLRRLIVGSLQDSGEGATLITFIHNYIRYKAGTDAAFGGFIKDKKHPDTNSNDPNAISSWEECRIKELYSAGDIALVQADLLDPIDLYWKLCIGLDEQESKLFEPSQEVNSEFLELKTESIGKGQMTLLQYVLSPLISHRLLTSVDREADAIYNALLAASAYLKRLGLLEQAIMMTTVKRNSKIMSGNAVNEKHRVFEEMYDKLDKIYPFKRRSQSRQEEVNSKTAYDISFTAIEDEFRRSQWRITLPHSDIVKFTGGLRVTRVYICPLDIKLVLAEFFIAMDESSRRIRFHRNQLLEKIKNVIHP